MPFPMPRPISGKRFAPKIRMMINRMMTSSGMPRRPIMALPFGYEKRRDCTTLAAVVAVLLGWGGALSAQFSSGVNLVEVYAAVTDEAGNPVTGLTRADFTVLED